MNPFRTLCGWVALIIAASALIGAPPESPGPVLVPGENDATWQPLFAKLAPTAPVWSPFTEQRHFPFRQKPTVLRGEMRLDPQRGLSLHYTNPEELTVVVDRQGLLQRDHRARTRMLPADSRAAAVNAALLPVLQFDQAEILRRFELHAARDGEDWRLDFVPRDPALQRVLGRLTTWGHGDVLDRLEFRRSDKQRVEILIEGATRGAEFSDEDLARFFR